MPGRNCRSLTANWLIEKEGKLKKLVNAVEHVTFSGPRGVEQGRDVTYVTERAVMKLTPQGHCADRNRAGCGFAGAYSGSG